MMMFLLEFTIIVVIFGVVTSKNYDVNLQTPFRGMDRKRSAEATTPISSDPNVENKGMKLLTRLEGLRIETLEFLIADTNSRFEFLENQLSRGSSCLSSPVIQNIENLELKVENLGKNIKELMDVTKNMPSSASPVVQNNENLEAKVEDLGTNIQELMDATRNLTSDVEAIKQNVSSLINVTRLQATSTTFPLNCTVQYPKNCRRVRESEKTVSGTYMIQPEGAPKPFEAVCDLKTRGGGWTVIQRRFDGSQEFYLDWQHYKNGFGNLGGEFWLGLENIHLLTGFEDNELLVELGDFESNNISASYSKFGVGSEIEGYSLKELGAYSGDAGGDSLIQQLGSKFTTYDNDQDNYASYNGAQRWHGAWWYNYDAYSNLNGKYFDRGQVPAPSYISVYWYNYKSYAALKHTRILVRPKV